MEIRLEDVEKVMEQTGVEYKAAKEALLQTGGDADAAIKLITKDTIDIGEEAKAAVEQLKKKVKEGNVDRIQIRKDDEVVFSVPVNIGIVGGIVGFATIPWAFIAAAVAAFGLGCKLEVVKSDGSSDEIN